jgi:transposase
MQSGGSTPLFEIERGINGLPTAQRLAIRQEQAAPLVTAMQAWMREERRKLSRHSDLAAAMDYMLKRWASFSRFLDDGRVCLTNNAAESGWSSWP